MADAPPNLPIPDWLAARLRSAGGGLSPRYETALYGPLNSFLTCSDIADDVDMVHVSIDFYGGEVLSRDEKGGEQSVKVPDFVVVKASASLHGDRVLMIVEVKRGDMSLDAA